DYNEPNLEDPKESGLGLFIIESLMDEFIIETKNGNGTVIKMIKNI
ncbi:MAG: ATP-binding protein, partial [Bacillota bacterium]|nr:ATP-binding protein [Bacillota bacterium]